MPIVIVYFFEYSEYSDNQENAGTGGSNLLSGVCILNANFMQNILPFQVGRLLRPNDSVILDPQKIKHGLEVFVGIFNLFFMLLANILARIEREVSLRERLHLYER